MKSSLNTQSTPFRAIILKLLPIFAFAVPLILLYTFNPYEPYNVTAQQSFELMWKGRTFQLFFIWLIALELILSWEKFQVTLKNQDRIAVYVITLLLPAIYVVAEYCLGLNAAIVNASTQADVAWASSMPLAVEYLAFSAFFLAAAYFGFGKKGLIGLLLPALFVALVGLLYTIDNIYPYGEFTPFQLLVPTTASIAAGLLSWMGYGVIPGTDAPTGMPTLDVSGPLGSAKFAIAWPCAGIESLLIFTAVALLFLKQIPISWKAKVSFFAVGAAVTYLINIVRIATLFTLGMQYGETSVQVSDFHYYYGPLYAMAWIVTYPLVIMGLSVVWQRFRRNQLVPPALA